LLKARGWAMSLTSGIQYNGTQFFLFNVKISLTESGLGHIYDICTIVFQYISLIKDAKSEDLKRLWSEKAKMLNTNFRFKEKKKTL